MRYDKPKPKFVLKTLSQDFLTLFNTYLVLENGWKVSEDVVSAWGPDLFDKFTLQLRADNKTLATIKRQY